MKLAVTAFEPSVSSQRQGKGGGDAGRRGAACSALGKLWPSEPSLREGCRKLLETLEVTSGT
jgi:hypothetical protein